MKRLVLVWGLPGAGKSTLAKKITYFEDKIVICEADQFMVNDKGDYEFNPKRLHWCHQKCQEKCEAAMIAGHSVIVSNTSLSKKERKPYLELAAKYGYDVQEIFIKSPFKSVHNVPEEKVEEMKKRLEF